MLNKPHNWMLFVDPDIFFSCCEFSRKAFSFKKETLLSSGIILEILDQLLDVLQRHRIVVAGTHTTHTPVALQPLEHALVSAGQKLLFFLSVSAVHTEADVHPAPNALVRDDAVHLRVLVQRPVDEVGFAVGNLFLTSDLLCTVRVDEVGHDLAGDPQVEDGEGVVEGVVLRDGGVVEHHGSWETTDVQPVEECSWGCGRLRGEEGFLDDGDGDTGHTNVLLGTSLS